MHKIKKKGSKLILLCTDHNKTTTITTTTMTMTTVLLHHFLPTTTPSVGILMVVCTDRYIVHVNITTITIITTTMKSNRHLYIHHTNHQIWGWWRGCLSFLNILLDSFSIRFDIPYQGLHTYSARSMHSYQSLYDDYDKHPWFNLSSIHPKSNCPSNRLTNKHLIN